MDTYKLYNEDFDDEEIDLPEEDKEDDSYDFDDDEDEEEVADLF